MKKISFNGLFEALSEKEMRNVIGGTPYTESASGAIGMGNCYSNDGKTCQGTCYYDEYVYGLYWTTSVVVEGRCNIDYNFPTVPTVQRCYCGKK